MSKSRHRKNKPAPGDVFQISLPDGRYAYGRVYHDAAVGIYREVSNDPQRPPIGSDNYLFIVGMYEDAFASDKCQIVGHDPFEDDDEAWPPPNSIIDPITGEHSIYYKGEIRSATEEECEGMEEAAVWELHDIVSRIMKEIGNQ